jgi:tRNA wybutosine-synthesizing protein 1
MIPEKTKALLKKQHYALVGDHSAVQVCRWTKKSIRGEGVCYKEKFYGIKSHQCCQMTPAVMWCQNKCLHCWRAIENTIDKQLKGGDSPKEIIDGCITAQKKMLQGFKNHKVTDMEKWTEAQEPMQFAISLSGEPTLYEKLGDLIEELNRRGKTSFLVTNGLYPEKLKELSEKKQLPTQLYVSVNAPNKELFDKISRSSTPNAWEKLLESLELMKDLRCRTAPQGCTPRIGDSTRSIFRMNLVRDLNMNDSHVEKYAELIEKSKPMFVEIKGFMSVGFARERLGYDRMPTDVEMKDFVDKLSKATGLKILDSHEFSRAWVLGKDKKKLKINNAVLS